MILFLFLVLFLFFFVDGFEVEQLPEQAGLRLAFMHIPKTGGTYLNAAIPQVLGVPSCNIKYNVPTHHLDLKLLSHKIENAIKGADKKIFGGGSHLSTSCNFLTEELELFHLNTMLKSMGYIQVDMTRNHSISSMNERSVLMMSSFRDPYSHFFSAFEHANLYSTNRNKNDPLGIFIDDNIHNAKSHKKTDSWHSQMSDIQSKWMLSKNGDSNDANKLTNKHANVKESVANMKKLFWFSIEYDIRLSFALLQCQVFGKLKPELLPKPENATYLNSGTKPQYKYKLSKEKLKQISDLTYVDQRFFEQVCAEFWRRVDVYGACLAPVLDSYEPSPVYGYGRSRRVMRGRRRRTAAMTMTKMTTSI